MRPALGAFFQSLKKSPPSPETVILFLGSSDEVGRVSEVDPEGLAASICPGVRVEAWPGRFPMLDALKSLQEADRLLFFGSEDPGYQPSRLQPYLRSGKPLLAILLRQSPAWLWASQNDLPGLVGFMPGEESRTVSERISGLDWRKTNSGRPKIYSAEEMTRDLCLLFEKAISARI